MTERASNRRSFLSSGGWTNPDANIKCDAIDREALLPEPVHIGCRGCASVIKAILAARVAPVEGGPAPVQLEAPWLRPGEDE